MVRKSGMFCECEKREDLKMLIGFLDLVPSVRCEDALGIQRPGSSDFDDGEKNNLRPMRSSALELLRPQGAPDSGSLLWRYPHLPGGGDAACLLPELQFGEVRATSLDFKQSLLHKALCVLCRQALPHLHAPRRCERVGAGLEDGQAIRQAIHAGAVAQAGNTRAERHRNRRDLHQEGTQLPDCRQRLNPSAAGLVWREGSFRREHGSVLSVAGTQEEQADSTGRDGHVEGLP